jgi:hypothetical protein
MTKGRVESFSDCVIAFAITLLVLDIHLQDVGTNIDSAEMIHAIMGQAAHFSVPHVDWISAIPNGTSRNSSRATCGSRPLRNHLRHYVPFFLSDALVRLLPGPSHEKRNSGNEAATAPAPFPASSSSLLCRHGRWVVLPVSWFVLLRRYPYVLHD